MSARFTPEARSSMSTSSSPGSGVGTSAVRSTSGPPNSSIRTAFMFRSSRLSPALAEVSFLRALTKDHTGGGCVAVELAPFVVEPRLGGGDAAADVDGDALAQKLSGIRNYRAEKVDLELDRGVCDAGGEHRVYGA